MKHHYIIPLLFSFLFFACNNSNQEEDGELVDVAYFTPVYESVATIASRVSVDSPIPYQQSGKVITYGDYIFINKPNEGIHVIDNANPEAPINLSFITLKGNLDMAIVDDHLYADMFSALVVLDIQDIQNPKIINDYTVEDVFYYDQFIFLPPFDIASEYDNVRYDYPDSSKGIVTDWTIEVRKEKLEDLYLFSDFALESSDIATGLATAQPSNVSSAGSMTRFLPVDNFLYTLSFNELILFELDANNRPNRWGKLDTSTLAETLFRLNDLLFVGSVSGMLMYDVADPANPSYINSIEHFRSCDPVVADTTHAYVTLRGGTNCFTDNNELQIIDIQNPEELYVASKHIMFNPHGLAVVDQHLIVCDGTAGIKVVDINDKTAPEVVNIYPIDFAYDVIVDYPTALVVGEQTMRQYDISNLPEMVKISELTLEAKD